MLQIRFSLSRRSFYWTRPSCYGNWTGIFLPITTNISRNNQAVECIALRSSMVFALFNVEFASLCVWVHNIFMSYDHDAPINIQFQLLISWRRKWPYTFTIFVSLCLKNKANNILSFSEYKQMYNIPCFWKHVIFVHLNIYVLKMFYM